MKALREALSAASVNPARCLRQSRRGVRSLALVMLLAACGTEGLEPGPEVGQKEETTAGQGAETGEAIGEGEVAAVAEAATVTPSKAIWRPAPGTSWQVQFAGTLDTTVSVQSFDLDLADTPKSTIDKLRSRGVKVICYFSAGSFEDWRSDAKLFPRSVLGSNLDGWPGERWLDVRKLDVLRPIMTKRMDQAAQKGCDAIDTDNMDVHTQDSGFDISYAQQIAYNRMLADEAHKRGLGIGLKNSLEQVKDLAELYDFAINEQCAEYNECAMLKPFISRNKAVFGIEFTGSKSSVCAKTNPLNHDTLLKNLNLDARRVPCR